MLRSKSSASLVEARSSAVSVFAEMTSNCGDRTGAGVDTARRIVEDKRLQIALQPASQYDFLLIAAGQILQRHQRRSRTNAELTDRGDRGSPLLLQTP